MKNIEDKVENAPEYLSKEKVIEELGAYSITPPTLRRHAFGPINISDIKDDQDTGINNKEKFSQEFSKIQEMIHDLNNKSEIFKSNFSCYKDNIQIDSVLSKLSNVASDEDLKSYLNNITSEHSKLLNKINTKNKNLESYQPIFEKFARFIEDYPKLCLNFEQDYENNGQLAKRYGINVLGLSDEQRKQLLSIYIPVEQVQKDVTTQSSKSGGTTSSKPNSGKEGKKDQAKPIMNPIKLTPLEIITLKDAVKYLDTNHNIKAVCVDIFAREHDGKIRLQEEKDRTTVETHVIVIHKNSNQEYCIVDPSNSNYSKHLEYNSEIIFGNTQAKFIAPTKEVIIYKGVKENTGPGKDQYRDCIDIAVKLTFGFNKAQSILDIKNLGSNNTVQKISNDPDIDSLIPRAKIPFKIKQASTDIIMDILKEMLFKIETNLNMLEKLPFTEDIARKFRQQKNDILENSIEHNKYNDKVKELLGLSNNVFDKLSEYTIKHDKDFNIHILGQLDLNKTEE